MLFFFFWSNFCINWVFKFYLLPTSHKALIHAVLSCYTLRRHDVIMSSPCAVCGALHIIVLCLRRLCQKAGVPLRGASAQVEPRLITVLSANPPRCQKAFLSYCVHHLYIALSHSSCSISCREARPLVGSCAVSAATFPSLRSSHVLWPYYGSALPFLLPLLQTAPLSRLSASTHGK